MMTPRIVFLIVLLGIGLVAAIICVKVLVLLGRTVAGLTRGSARLLGGVVRTATVTMTQPSGCCGPRRHGGRPGVTSAQTRTCPDRQCQFVNRPGARYCARCGRPLR